MQFGVAYMIGYNGRMQSTITVRKEVPAIEFKDEIVHAAGELYALFSETCKSLKVKMQMRMHVK